MSSVESTPEQAYRDALLSAEQVYKAAVASADRVFVDASRCALARYQQVCRHAGRVRGESLARAEERYELAVGAVGAVLIR